jgi:hypothetical protein
MDHSTAATVAAMHGYVSVALSIIFPLILWFVMLESWKPQTRLLYATRFTFWPLVILSSGLGGPVSRELIFEVHSNFMMSLADSLIGVLTIWLIAAPIFFYFGWRRGSSVISGIGN